jgi:hypothetical protein
MISTISHRELNCKVNCRKLKGGTVLYQGEHSRPLAEPKASELKNQVFENEKLKIQIQNLN